jgi:hypothetical protein
VDRTGYFANVRRAAAFEFHMRLAGPAGTWDGPVTPAAARFEPGANVLILPAGLLQPPFFDAHGDDAANFGALGTVIGGELARLFGTGGSGVELAFAALPRTPAAAGGPTCEKRFFLGFARSAPDREHVNATLAALPAFKAAFGCGD